MYCACFAVRDEWDTSVADDASCNSVTALVRAEIVIRRTAHVRGARVTAW
jgi:hypothetical protein